MERWVKIRNISSDLVLVGHLYLMPGERRRVPWDHYQTADKRNPHKLLLEEPKMGMEPPPEPDDLTQLDGIGHKRAEALNKAGITTFEQLAAADLVELAGRVDGLTPEMAEILISRAQERIYGSVKE